MSSHAIISPSEAADRLSIRELIEAYTLNGARLLGWQQEAGSIEVGKSADFVLIDRDILALADDGQPQAAPPAQLTQPTDDGTLVNGVPLSEAQRPNQPG